MTRRYSLNYNKIYSQKEECKEVSRDSTKSHMAHNYAEEVQVSNLDSSDIYSQDKITCASKKKDLKLIGSDSLNSKACPDTCICGHAKEHHKFNPVFSYCIETPCNCLGYEADNLSQEISVNKLKKIIEKDSTKAYVDLVHWLWTNHKDVLREFERTKGNLRVEFA